MAVIVKQACLRAHPAYTHIAELRTGIVKAEVRFTRITKVYRIRTSGSINPAHGEAPDGSMTLIDQHVNRDRLVTRVVLAALVV